MVRSPFAWGNHKRWGLLIVICLAIGGVQAAAKQKSDNFPAAMYKKVQEEQAAEEGPAAESSKKTPPTAQDLLTGDEHIHPALAFLILLRFFFPFPF